MAPSHRIASFGVCFEGRGRVYLCWLALRPALAFVFTALVVSGCHGYSKEQNQEMQRIRDLVRADPARINLPHNGNTPLHLAALNNYLPLMDWLKDHGADPNSKGLHGDTPLHVAVISDRSSDNRVIRSLLQMGADVNASNDYGETPLHRAAYHGLTEKLRFLLKNRADVSARARRGETPLLYAARPEGHPETVFALLEAGADVDAADDIGMTPLHGAAMIGDVDVARILLDTGHADVNRQTIDGYTPLHIAALFGKAEFVQLLLEKGANRDLRDKRNLTPAERAVQFPAMSYSKDGQHAVDTSAAVKVLRTYSVKD
jgi:ankyrin repeat protein